MTPGRLALHEDALVGLQMRASHVYGSFDAKGSYSAYPSDASEEDFEQDVMASARVPFAPSLQLSLLVPFVETRRTAGGASDFGGGLGDVNLSARYDITDVGRSRYVPGIAVLAGLTFPTGTPPEEASAPLAASATGVGAFQGNVGIAVEQSFGAWLVSAYGIVAQRAPRTIRGTEIALGAQWTGLVAVAYTFDDGAALAGSVSYTVEGDADVDGRTVPSSSRRIPSVGLFGVYPFSDHFRIQGGPSFTPPIEPFGRNQIATVGLTATAVVAWY